MAAGLLPTKSMLIVPAPAAGGGRRRGLDGQRDRSLWLSVPLVPVTSAVNVPAGVDADVVTVSVELPDPVIERG